MAKKKAAPANRHIRAGKKQLGHFIDQDVYDALIRCQQSQVPAASITGHLNAAILEYLTKRGFWPPPGDDPSSPGD